MGHEKPSKPRHVVGLDGQSLTLDNLPPADIKRWTIRRKAEVVLAVQAGLITPRKVCERYCMSIEELWSWGRLLDRHGMQGLRVTRLQKYQRPMRTIGNGTMSSSTRSERGATDWTALRPKQDDAWAHGETAGR